jgi:hypothetical protein
MQKCPKCGYRERRDWPTILRGLFFYGLCGALILGASRRFRLIALGAMVLFSLVQLWESSRSGRNLELVRSSGDGGNLSLKPPANG